MNDRIGRVAAASPVVLLPGESAAIDSLRSCAADQKPEALNTLCSPTGVWAVLSGFPGDIPKIVLLVAFPFT
jgi:hypothetical protein